MSWYVWLIWAITVFCLSLSWGLRRAIKREERARAARQVDVLTLIVRHYAAKGAGPQPDYLTLANRAAWARDEQLTNAELATLGR
jgi:hypothetical protein